VAWDFSTDQEFEKQLAWMRQFVAEEVEPLELLWPQYHHRVPPSWLKKVIDPLKQRVKERGLWACHLGPELGGRGFGQVKLSLMNEILAPYQWGPTIFGVQGPDTGNAEIIAHYGTAEQKAKYLQPLLDGEVFSTFAMTEPAGGSDPRLFTFRATRDGDSWVLDGEKFFASNASSCAFYIVMAVTNPDVSPYKGISMFFVEADTPGIEVVRHTGYMNEPYGQIGPIDHPHVRFNGVRVPASNLLGTEGDGFMIAQTRLSGGRVHHAMRAVGQAQYAFDMMCERALSRRSGDGLIADKQMVQEAIAQSYAQIEMFRLFVLRTAWMIDQGGGYTWQVRREIAAAKVLSAQVMRDVLERAVHIHGALGVSNEMPLGELWQLVPGYGIWDGPTEAHVTTVARQVLKDYQPAEGMWPSQWRPERLRRAQQKHAGALAEQAAGDA
jgi:acyl-CoA dehydrogenase